MIFPAVIVSLGLGKALNNTNVSLPGYAGSVRVSVGTGTGLDAGYTRLGASQLGADTAIGSAGIWTQRGHWRYSLDAITGASYDAAVWWDASKPGQVCGVEACGKEYVNDGVHFSRACHLCGGSIAVERTLGKRLAFRAEYIGLRHMTPTFQGVIVQVTYSLQAH